MSLSIVELRCPNHQSHWAKDHSYGEASGLGAGAINGAEEQDAKILAGILNIRGRNAFFFEALHTACCWKNFWGRHSFAVGFKKNSGPLLGENPWLLGETIGEDPAWHAGENWQQVGIDLIDQSLGPGHNGDGIEEDGTRALGACIWWYGGFLEYGYHRMDGL